MKTFLLHLLVTSLAAFFTAKLLPGIHIEGYTNAILLALIIGVLNVFIRPLLVLLTLPLTIFTFGLFLLVINALIILMAARLTHGFQVDSFWSAFFFSIILSMITSFMTGFANRH